MFIAEQQLIAAATGLAVRGYRPYASTFETFPSAAPRSCAPATR
jgi:transketolase